MQSVRKIAMLDALGVVAYSRVRRVKLQVGLRSGNDNRAELGNSDARNLQRRTVVNEFSSLVARSGMPAENSNTVAQVSAAASLPVVKTTRPVTKSPIAPRAASVRSELVLPSAEIERFLDSRMYRHICLLLAQGTAIPVVENAVVSDTALHFELPPKSPIKLGSMALLRSAWRAKRQAWLAIRLWRKQQS